MYEVFDSYLRVDTWHTNHPLDIERFNTALALVVEDDKFNPDEMAKYFTERNGSTFADVIEERRVAAWAVKEFLGRKI